MMALFQFAEQIQELVEENREEIVKETYRNKVNLYRNYCNTNQLFEPGKNCCRLLGYYVDLPKKGKSISYNFDMANFVYEDTPIFDFIPFAFCGERDFYFINDNVDLRELVKTNKILQDKIKKARENARQKIRHDATFRATGYDIDDSALAIAKKNAEIAGVADRITFANRDIKDFELEDGFQTIRTE